MKWLIVNLWLGMVFALAPSSPAQKGYPMNEAQKTTVETHVKILARNVNDVPLWNSAADDVAHVLALTREAALTLLEEAVILRGVDSLEEIGICCPDWLFCECAIGGTDSGF